MKVSQELLDQMITHAVEDSPNECCGLLGGEGDMASTVYRAENAEKSPYRYSIAPREQLELMNRIEEAGESIVGIYHSHTRTAAYPSQTDINLAIGWPDSIYLIVSLENPDEPYVRGFRIRDGRVEDVDLQTR
ncbi:MAG: M67 family metallopeptidase [Solirubrobacterales bacterium]|nr:M67 family metallopeptidase [Solirubrobacterales bacterium]